MASYSKPEVSVDQLLAILGGVVVEKWLLEQRVAELETAPCSCNQGEPCCKTTTTPCCASCGCADCGCEWYGYGECSCEARTKPDCACGRG